MLSSGAFQLKQFHDSDKQDLQMLGDNLRQEPKKILHANKTKEIPTDEI